MHRASELKGGLGSVAIDLESREGVDGFIAFCSGSGNVMITFFKRAGRLGMGLISDSEIRKSVRLFLTERAFFRGDPTPPSSCSWVT